MKTRLPLKKVPFINADGNNLGICEHCFGTGTRHHATRIQKNENGEPRTESAFIKQGQVKAYKKDGWMIETSRCTTCGGGGVVLSSTAHTW